MIEESSSLRSAVSQALLDSHGTDYPNNRAPPPLKLDLGSPSSQEGGRQHACACHIPGQPCRAEEHKAEEPYISERARRLHELRALFIPLYREAVPTTGGHAGWMNWFSHLMPAFSGNGGAPGK